MGKRKDADQPTATKSNEQLRDEALEAERIQMQKDVEAIQAYSYHSKGRRDTRHPSSIPLDELKVARQWYADEFLKGKAGEPDHGPDGPRTWDALTGQRHA